MSAPSPEKRDVIISKTLSYLLRHGAEKEKLEIDDEGYIKIPYLLNHQRLKSNKVTRDDLVRIVENNDKKRFTIDEEQDSICANQGHSLKKVTNANLEPMALEDLIALDIYHGTYKKKLSNIKESGGLNKMSRNHIHFTCKEYNTLSGIRSTANVLVYADVEQCVANGIQFFKSLNNVILTEGDSKGQIPWEFISKIVDIHGNELNKDNI
ncbi:tRNA 2'-phosphotransferase [Spathaspora sp. JA1]|nr:tRNA 2'-phosphotransferase [Spathaspora sp. JA1]